MNSFNPTNLSQYSGQRLRKDALVFLSDAPSLGLAKSILGKGIFHSIDFHKGNIDTAFRYFEDKTMPLLVIVDISDSEMPLGELERFLTLCPPDVKVLAVGDKDNIALYRDLLKLGVCEYLIKPLPQHILHQSVQVAMGNAPPEMISARHARKVAVIGMGGGVGASVIAAGVSHFLSQKLHRKTMLLDCHEGMGAQTLIYGLKPHTGLSELCADPHRVDPLFLSRSTENIMPRLDLLAADGGVADDAHLNIEKLGKLFGIIQSKYHFVISDLPRNFYISEEAGRSNFAQIIVVFDRRLSSLRNLQQFTSALEKANANTEIILVLNDVRPVLKTDFPLQKIREVISEQIDMIIPYDGRGFSQAQVAAKPITEIKSCAGDRIRNLAEKLANQRSSSTRSSFLTPVIRRFKNG